MLNQLKDYPNTHFHILFGAQYITDMFYLEDFYKASEASNVSFYPCLSRHTEPPQHCYSGYVQSILEQLVPNSDTDMAYLCGNPFMVDEVFELLKNKDFTVKQVKREKYVFSKY